MDSLSNELVQSSHSNSEEFILYNPYAEDLIFMGILSNHKLLHHVFSEVDEKLFYLKSNQIIFQNMRDLYMEGNIPTTISLIYKLEKHQLLNSIGGKERILHLSKLSFPLTIEEIHGYITLLKDKQIKRKLFNLSLDLYQLAYNYDTFRDINFEQLEIQLGQIIKAQSVSTILVARDLIQPALDQMRRSDENLDTSSKISTGFASIDFYLNGLERGNLVIVAGRPSMGKTALALSLIMNVCQQIPKACILLFSLEMSSTQIIHRLMSIESNLPLEKLKQSKLYNLKAGDLKTYFPNIYESNIYINDNNLIQLNEIQLVIKKIYNKHKKVDLVIIDYLQLLGNSTNNRALEIGQITRQLKGIARKFNVPIIALSQLNRNVEQRSNKKPLLADLRESGCLTIHTDISLQTLSCITEIKQLVPFRFVSIAGINTANHSFQSVLIYQGKFHGIKHVYQIQLKNHLSIKLTANHKILTRCGWKRIDYLNKCDIIATLSQNYTTLNWVMVNCVNYLGKLLTSDLQVPPFANFCANYIVTHNSIEQDADSVLFLYRPSYYSSEKEDHQIAEIIIAKNRNGQTGNVLLKFIPQVAKFQ
uniref:Replicative DNA helicase n=1 Tax=Rhodosorus marinus TaxID=101924 RepID=A0A7S3A8K9_9RHOD|mmetsp:Transcript_6339/g.27014  ORF Transcript_6339/g.27014 Transcript_6339/m.27014 type:complete len:590 (+) Transcript_6339:732-2501(+)